MSISVTHGGACDLYLDVSTWPGKRSRVARARANRDDVQVWPGKRPRAQRRLAQQDPAVEADVDSRTATRADVLDIEEMLARADKSVERGDLESAIGWARQALVALNVDLDAEIERLAPSSPSLAELLREWRASSG